MTGYLSCPSPPILRGTAQVAEQGSLGFQQNRSQLQQLLMDKDPMELCHWCSRQKQGAKMETSVKTKPCSKCTTKKKPLPNATLWFLLPLFTSWTHRCLQRAHFSQITFRNLPQICLCPSFAEIIYPAHSCSISRCWPESLIIVQVSLRLPALKERAVLSHSTAADVGSCEGACGWHEDRRKIHQRCCLWIECSFLYQSLSENLAVHPTPPAQDLHI